MKNSRKKRNLKKVYEAGCSDEDYKSPEETLKSLKAGIKAKKKNYQGRENKMSSMLDRIIDKLSKIS